MTRKILHLLTVRIWEIRLKELSPVQAFLVRYLRVFVLAVWEFYKDNCPVKASALTYYSLLSIVPIIALVFGVAKGFGLEKIIQQQILELSQGTHWQGEVMTRALTFSVSLLEHTKGGVIAGIGTLFLIWTLISILGNIEASFNEIWEVKKSRSLVRKFSDYISILVFTPLLLILSSSVTVFVTTEMKLIVKEIAFLGVLSPMIFFLLKVLPYISIWILLTLNYIVLPNTKVRLQSGILAAIVTGTIYQLFQGVYIDFQIGVAQYGAIYGSFAALPLFLIWLQLSWMIVLFGAEIAFANENVETFGYHPNYAKISLSSRKLLILKIYHLLIKRFSRGEGPLSAGQIAKSLEIPARLVRWLLHELTVAGLVIETAKEIRHEATYQPSRDIHDITVKTALDTYEGLGRSIRQERSQEEDDPLLKYLRNISEAMERAPGNVVLREIG